MARTDRLVAAAKIDLRIGRRHKVRYRGERSHPHIGRQVAFEVTDDRGNQEVLHVPEGSLNDPAFDEARWLREQMMQVHP